jgi:hypothetical protein
MAGTVYSTQFYQGTPVAGLSNIYTVPAGYRAILRDLDGVLGFVDGNLALFNLGVNFNGIYAQAIVGNQNLNLRWRGRQVLDPGDSITVTYVATSATLQIVVSGYLLTLP